METNINNLEDMLLNRFNTLSDQEIAEGMSWYRDAHNWCLKVAKWTRQPLFRVVGVLSALSPRNKWHRNKVDAIELIKRGKRGKYATFNANRDKALKILKANSVDEVRKLLNGRKITSFFNNIMYPTVNSTVTVDAWAIRTIGLDKVTNKTYNMTELAYKNVADQLGLKAHNLQAMLWVNIRENWNNEKMYFMQNLKAS